MLLKTVLIVLGVIVGLVALLVFLSIQATRKAVRASDQFMDAVQSGNAPLAYSLFSTDAKKTISPDSFSKIIKTVSPILNNGRIMVDKEVSSSTDAGTIGKVIYSVRGTDGLQYTVIVNLSKEGGEWKIVNFDSRKS